MRLERERGSSQKHGTASDGTPWVYAFVNIGLVGIWYYSGQGFPWPIFPIVFWGLGLTSHYLSAYRDFGREWIERETDRILQREAKKQLSTSA